MQSQIIVNNLLVSYIEQKGNSEKTFLFLHGWRSNKEVWAGVVNKLVSLSANQHSSFFAIDLPGFGQSQIPASPMTMGDYANVVAEFIKKLELQNVIIVGHSFGGRIGIKLASKYPNLISRLILVDSAGFPMASSKKNLFNAAAKIVKPFFKPKFMQGLRKIIYKRIGAEDYLATPELQKTFVNITSEDLSADMKNIKVPTSIINGENDQDTPVEFGRRMNGLIQNSKFKILAAAGHFSFLDKPEEFIETLMNFYE